MNSFKSITKQKLGYYVYILTYKDKGKETVFYVGKGKNDRVFSHFEDVKKLKTLALQEKNFSVQWSDKQEVIANSECYAYIVSAELSEDQAFLVEATLINVLRTFKNLNLLNIVEGKHAYDIKRAEVVDHQYASPINLEEFCKKHNKKVLAFKVRAESYTTPQFNDYRAVLEGIWQLNTTKLEQIDYVVGVYNQTIFAVYEYVKGSYRLVKDLVDNKEWENWLDIHFNNMKRPQEYLKNDCNFINFYERKGVIELKPISVPETQTTFNETLGIKGKEKKFADKLLNKTINDEKVDYMSSKLYFGFE